MEGLMLLGVNVAIVIISAWAIMMDKAPPEKVKQALDIPPPKRKRSRFGRQPWKPPSAPPQLRR